jgi:hypothetical protein
MVDMQDALAQFAKAEANLDKAVHVWDQIRAEIPSRGFAFGCDTPELKQLRLAFSDLCGGLPPIDGYSVDGGSVLDPDSIAQGRIDAMEIGYEQSFDDTIYQPQELLDGYRARLKRARRALAVGQIRAVVVSIDEMLSHVEIDGYGASWRGPFGWADLQRSIRELEQLVGDTLQRTGRWGDLHRHMRFAMTNDLHDIVSMDWPSVRAELEPVMFNDQEPLPVDTSIDLGALERSMPIRPSAGPQPLAWGLLDDERFERLIYVLLQPDSGV